MQGLLQRIDQLVDQRQAGAWARLARLLAAGDAAGDAGADELQSIMTALDLSADDVKKFAAVRAEIDRCAALAARVGELRPKAERAQAAWSELHASLSAKVRALEAEISKADAAARQAQGELSDAREAADRLLELQVDNGWMLYEADGTPVVPSVRVLQENVPSAPIDPRVRSIDLARVFSAEELSANFGIAAAWLEHSRVPRMPGGGYYGATVWGWAAAALRIQWDRRRARLRDQLVKVDVRLLKLEPGRYYRPDDLRPLGFPQSRVDAGKEILSARRSDGSFTGAEVAEWARQAMERDARAREELAAMDLEEESAAAAPAETPAATDPAPEPAASAEPDAAAEPAAEAAPAPAAPADEPQRPARRRR